MLDDPRALTSDGPGIHLTRNHFDRNTLDVAPFLLGKILVVSDDNHLRAARIVETEAYLGIGDEASHAARGVTKRNSVMFGPAGFSYVYFNYGVHSLFNVVTENEGVAGAVLIRACEPLLGVDHMFAARNTSNYFNLCSGPGKLAAALGITLSHDRMDLVLGTGLYITDDGFIPGHIISTSRVGISRSTDLPWRYYLKDNPHVSKR